MKTSADSFVEDPAQWTGEVAVSRDVVDAPDGSVPVETPRIVGREMQSDVGRERPVEEPRGEAVMRRERQPVPDGVAGHGARPGELAEVPKEMAFRRRREAGEARRERAPRVRHPAKGQVRTVAPE